MLDIEVAARWRPVRDRVYFAPNTDQGFHDGHQLPPSMDTVNHPSGDLHKLGRAGRLVTPQAANAIWKPAPTPPGPYHHRPPRDHGSDRRADTDGKLHVDLPVPAPLLAAATN